MKSECAFTRFKSRADVILISVGVVFALAPFLFEHNRGNFQISTVHFAYRALF